MPLHLVVFLDKPSISGIFIFMKELIKVPNRIFDLTGKRFGKLVVLGLHSHHLNNNKFNEWYCLCDCGGDKLVLGVNLRRGATKSCGCLIQESPKYRSTHGAASNGAATPEYRTYNRMKYRCYNPKCKDYKNYGGRGIEVCKRWLDSFPNFLKDVGLRPSSLYSLDRYPDMNGNYEPTNCRWATKKQQNGNRRTNYWLEYKGERLIIKDWADKLGIEYKRFFGLLSRESFSDFMDKYEKYGIVDRRTMPDVFYKRKSKKNATNI